MSQEIMIPAHPDWQNFKRILARTVRAERCDHDFVRAQLILARHFPDVNAPASVAFFQQHGAYCDCEILFNL